MHINGLCQGDSKTPEIGNDYLPNRKDWGFSWEGARASSPRLPRLTFALFFSSAFHFPADILNYIACTSRSGKGHRILT